MKRLGFVISATAFLFAVLLAVFAGGRAAHPLAAKVHRATQRTTGNWAVAANNSSSDDVDASGRVSVIRFANNGEPVPPFLVRDLDGDPVSTAAFQGKVVILSFWATWCPPCREEIPELEELQTRYKDRLQILGISIDEAPPENVKQFAANEKINYPIVMASPQMIQEYGGVPALPTNFVVDTLGRVVQKHVGLYPVEVYDQEIRALLNMPTEAKVETFTDVGQIFLKNAVNATELPGVDLSKLTPEQKKIALKRLNSEACSCGCGMTLAQCRINDATCPVSKDLAEKIVQEVGGATSRTAQPSDAKRVTK